MPEPLRDNPAFEALRDHNKALALEALQDPARRDELQISLLLALYQEQSDAGDYCRKDCRPGLKAEIETVQLRVGRLERVKAWLFGVGAALLAVGGLVLTVLEIVKLVGGG